MTQMIIANWKMNLTLNEAILLTETAYKHKFSKELIIAPPTPYISYLKAQFEKLKFCAQDVSIKNGFGSYTGENSAKFFKSCKIDYAIIGHSERRNMFGETNQMVRIKVQNCLDNSITPIVCIGESREIRQKKNYKEYLLNQLQESIPSHDANIIIAYEPIWSIGTGDVPTILEIEEIFELIRSFDHSHLAKKMKLVYGGSVNSENCKDILKVTDISGVLVGSASLNKDELLKLLTS